MCADGKIMGKTKRHGGFHLLWTACVKTAGYVGR
jgi:hypothetical protein